MAAKPQVGFLGCAIARRPAGPAQSSALHDFARSGPTKEAHRRAINRSGELLRSEAGRLTSANGPGREAFGVVQLHPLGTLQVDEVAQGRFAKPEQRDLHAWGYQRDRIGKFGRYRWGAAPIAVSRLVARARCNISCLVTSTSTCSQAATLA